MSAAYYLNGVVCHDLGAGLSDRAFNYGDGFFETMLLRITPQYGFFPLLSYHLERIKQSGEVLGLDTFGLKTELLDLCTDFRKKAPAGDYICKLHVSREAGPRGYRGVSTNAVRRVSISAKPEKKPNSVQGHLVRLTVCNHPLSRNPKLAGIKHLNRLDQVLARNEWDGEFYEGVMLNIQGCPVECTAHNLFWVKKDQIFTPDLSQEGVSGVVRRWLLNEFNVTAGCYSLKNLFDADEVFVTNALNGVVSVGAIGDKIYQAGKVTAEVQQQYQLRIAHPPVTVRKGLS